MLCMVLVLSSATSAFADEPQNTDSQSQTEAVAEPVADEATGTRGAATGTTTTRGAATGTTTTRTAATGTTTTAATGTTAAGTTTAATGTTAAGDRSSYS